MAGAFGRAMTALWYAVKLMWGALSLASFVSPYHRYTVNVLIVGLVFQAVNIIYSQDIPSLSSQSEHAKMDLHWCGIVATKEIEVNTRVLKLLLNQPWNDDQLSWMLLPCRKPYACPEVTGTMKMNIVRWIWDETRQDKRAGQGRAGQGRAGQLFRLQNRPYYHSVHVDALLKFDQTQNIKHKTR